MVSRFLSLLIGAVLFLGAVGEARSADDQQVSLEVRIVSLSDAVFTRCRQSLGAERATKSPECDAQHKLQSPVFLTPRQMRQFIETIQGDTETNVMQAPRLVVMSGQTNKLAIQDQHYFVTGINVVQVGNMIVGTPRTEAIPTGVALSVKPLVSADRRFVEVDLDFKMTEQTSAVVPLFPVVLSTPGGPKVETAKPAPSPQYVQQPSFSTLALSQSLCIPDGGTVMVGGWKRMADGGVEFDPPFLSKIPFADLFFDKNVGYGRRSELVFLMVTPRILASCEEHQVPPAAAKVSAKQPCTGGAEESECPCHCPQDASQGHDQHLVAKLVAQYHQACSAGHLAQATQAAVQALALDPTCFSNPSESHAR